ncbi:hypothetical protein GCM10010399_82630 [Dactylosporangium fulvum]|uniref:Uncharacterized protein n=1 Tax=Dactylosporangium fulvum TaxID=53359 RepID=A0ABY5W978_9ACTN|nr:hypothetical protein [Dactylosporangium fulvum]UWP85866.1 hypothetical protein Dfulv_17105 [Dactylosporangium fulvum]
MPTYAQLQAESWWGREIVTPELRWLGDELCRRTGRPRDAAGNKGNNVHLRGAHRSQEWNLNSRYSTSRTYTTQSGLTAAQARHIAGFDFTPGSPEDMIAQSRRLMAAVKAGVLEEVRELYCNVDGDKVVDGWDNVRNRAATSDSSHLWHWHLTIDRRHCADRALMERIVAIALGDVEDDMQLSDRTKLGIDVEQILVDTWAAALADRDPANEYRPDIDRFKFPNWNLRIHNKLAALEASQAAANAADEVRDRATLAAIQGIAAATGADPTPIINEVRAVRDEARTKFAELLTRAASAEQRAAAAEAEVKRLRTALAAGAKAEADAISGT